MTTIMVRYETQTRVGISRGVNRAPVIGILGNLVLRGLSTYPYSILWGQQYVSYWSDNCFLFVTFCLEYFSNVDEAKKINLIWAKEKFNACKKHNRIDRCRSQYRR